MKRQRLKDRIRIERQSPFATFLHVALVVMGFGAVLVTFLRERPHLDRATAGMAAPPRPAPQGPRHAVVIATANGSYYWDGRGPFAIEGFAGQLASWRSTTPNPELVIGGDADARLADTLFLLDEARRQGVQATRVEPASPPTR